MLTRELVRRLIPRVIISEEELTEVLKIVDKKASRKVE